MWDSPHLGEGPTVKTITVTWRAFNSSTQADSMRHHGKEPVTSATFTYDTDLDDLALCEQVFRDTNLYEGPIWDLIAPVLPAKRTHTALSVVFGRGDYVSIDGRVYEVADIGFTCVAGLSEVTA